MSQPPRVYPWSDTAPKLAQLTNEMLFDDVWERPGLSKRERSLITVARWSMRLTGALRC